MLGSSPITRTLPTSKARQKSGPFPPPALPGLSSTTALSDSRRGRRSWRRRGRYPRLRRVSPDCPRHPSSVLCPLPRRIERVLVSITSPFTRPSPHFGRVGIRIMDFEACSDFTRVTARWIARPPEAAFVTRLRPVRLPVQAARQLPDQSTTLWAEPSSTGDTRLRGAPKRTQIFPTISIAKCSDAVAKPPTRSAPKANNRFLPGGRPRPPADPKPRNLFLRRGILATPHRGRFF